MRFEQPCFINKQTPELIEKLVQNGYKTAYNIEKYPNIVTMCNGLIRSIPTDSINKFIEKVKNNGKNYINCDDNEDLFLALAFLQKYTSINQWFISDENEWLLCEGIMGDKLSQNKEKYHKASINEIIEHLKNRRED